MIEKLKTGTLIFLVALSLLQSYFLVYRMPGLGTTVRSDFEYVNAEPMGKPATIESMIFPDNIIIHMGNNKHTVLDPSTQFYEMILKQRIMGREFKGFQRTPVSTVDWNEVRKNDIGLELHFANGVAVELLQKLLKIEGDLLFLKEKIDRIWIYKVADTEEVRTFFFSSDDKMMYESVRADLTVRDVQDYVGFGQYLPLYEMISNGLYVPYYPIQATELIYEYDTYSPEQMQRSLFADPSSTLAVEDRSGSLLFTDGKRGLQIDQTSMWINYTNSAATLSTQNNSSENVYASIEFVNQHGGWDGTYQLLHVSPDSDSKYVRFRKYVEQYPVVEWPSFRYGHMRLLLQQGVVTEYVRSLITLHDGAEQRTARWLPAGETVKNYLKGYDRRSEVMALYPAFKAVAIADDRLQFEPVWAVKLLDGTEDILAEAYPVGYVPPERPADEEQEE